jgi:hypothetical protein
MTKKKRMDGAGGTAGENARASEGAAGSSGGVKRKIGAGEEKHTIPVQGSCNEHAEAVKLLSSYDKGVRKSLVTLSFTSPEKEKCFFLYL